MKIAVIGSRSLHVDNLGDYLPGDTAVIVTGGARGVDASAKAWALAHQLELMEILPDYSQYGRSAPLRRNLAIIQQADMVLAFWDGTSRGTAFVIEQCRRRGIPCRVIAQVPQG